MAMGDKLALTIARDGTGTEGGRGKTVTVQVAEGRWC